MKKQFLLAASVVSICLLSSCGSNENKTAGVVAPANAGEPAPVSAEGNTAAAAGEEVYKRTCIACHQANGEGIANTFPPLAHSDFLSNRDAVIEQVIKGKSGEMVVNGVTYNNAMPPQALTDAEIASVLSYVYNSWGNSGNAFTADEVKAIRDKVQ